MRALEPDDAEALAAYLNHPDLAGRRYLPWSAPEAAPLARRPVEQALNARAEDKAARQFAVVLTETGAVIGHAECSRGWDPHCPEIAIVIAPACQRRGYGTAVLPLLLRHLFETTPAHNVGAWLADWNLAAAAFALRRGFADAGRSTPSAWTCCGRSGRRKSRRRAMALDGRLRRLREERADDMLFLLGRRNDVETQAWSRMLPPDYTEPMYQKRFPSREFSFDRHDGRFLIVRAESGERAGISQ